MGRTRYGEKSRTDESRCLDQFFKEAVATILPGRYRHFKGNGYEVICIARHSETEEPMVVYKALYGDGEVWCRPAAME